jgi:hypothetical protein
MSEYTIIFINLGLILQMPLITNLHYYLFIYYFLLKLFLIFQLKFLEFMQPH